MTREHGARDSLLELEDSGAFLRRHIGPSDIEIADMLEAIGQPSLDSLVDSVVPASIRQHARLALPGPVSEEQALARIRGLARKNRLFRTFIGQGYYGTFTPNVIVRNVLENPAWYTAYTPYQAEISQGRLEALLNFQTMVCDLTGMDICNASLLDEGTAAAEAMTLMRRSSKNASNVCFVSEDCHPQTLAVVRTRAEALGIEIQTGDTSAAELCDAFGVLLQYPATTGELRDYSDVVAAASRRGALVAVAADLLALALLEPPGAWGAAIVIGSTQRFGVPMGYGGPHAAFLACREAYQRSLPGRLVGVSIDAHARPAYRLALQTREQHIRREKATSNICTAQVLLAVMAAMYAVYHGPDGIRRIAQRVHRLTSILAAGLDHAGLEVTGEFFDTIKVSGIDAAAVTERARERCVNLRELGPRAVGISLDETTTRADLALLWAIFGVEAEVEGLDRSVRDAIPERLARRSAFLTHPVFNTYRSETEMLRYLRRLADKDLALDRSMIPLGSCTMKLNATAEMIPVSWPEFADLHPFVPEEQAVGYRELTQGLEGMLAECTGYDAVSLQPNSGAQGEYAGLLAIRAYHRARGERQRDVCLIPASAHGTNPASAQLAGFRVVVVDCDTAGNVDVDDLARKAQAHAAKLAALMITYPSTHGVFEERVVEICEIVHAHGGQVYTDGANLNALLGIAKPGEFGSDVSHLNLHKTFCIPHGGGGPGVGPLAVKAHLAPHLPAAHVAGASAPYGVGPVSSAPYGSAGILPISWMYVTLMGGEGLAKATRVALLSANYVARRLDGHYSVLYAGRGGYVAHECILDLREIQRTTGVTAEDVAKRLIDYAFHAPTLSFPVAGTLMIEPTESESKAELDRFIEAMVAIREEIRAIERGDLDRDDNPLANAPHTAAAVAADDWPHGYTREQAAFPVPRLKQAKVWPPVARVDNVHGDRHLACSCPPVSSYA